MTRSQLFAVVVALLATIAGGQALADAYIVTANVPVRLALPAPDVTPDAAVYIRAAGGQWQKVPFTLADGRILLTPNPKEAGGAQMYLLINPPAELDIYDQKPPILLGVKADGKPKKADANLDLGASSQVPQIILWGVADRENSLDLSSLKVILNGEVLGSDRVKVTPVSRRQVGIQVDMGELDYGEHSVQTSIKDAFPQSNTLNLSAKFTKIDTANVIQLLKADIVVKVDSNFSSYPSLAPLTDGFNRLSGSGSGNDVTWASAEVTGDHWIDVTLPKAVPLSEVTLYWAYTGGTFYTSQNIEIQVAAGDGWKTVAKSPAEGLQEGRNNTIKFNTVTTDHFRVYQPSGGGPASRPEIMWLAEVEAR